MSREPSFALRIVERHRSLGKSERSFTVSSTVDSSFRVGKVRERKNSVSEASARARHAALRTVFLVPSCCSLQTRAYNPVEHGSWADSTYLRASTLRSDYRFKVEFRPVPSRRISIGMHRFSKNVGFANFLLRKIPSWWLLRAGLVP